ncbi:hypothetical protein CYY_004369 [Polysphondylium violaceum]|uniref:Heat shock protein 70 family member n=1 Tax=Polysphondylium violaceum TaxID=133409 RepID=A0A8J4V7T7_9MYCE|nr:hypothetical protein CYY_004369 [Polysphondylium violaceum]
MNNNCCKINNIVSSKMMKMMLMIFGIIFMIQCINANVIGIDLGSQTFKVALIKTGNFDIVLNEQSGRKTISSIGWFRNERVFSADSFGLWARNPQQTYNLITPFLGTQYQDGYVQKVGGGILGYSVSNDTDRNTFAIRYDDQVNYSPEELTGMLLERIRELTTLYSGIRIKDCVITIPAFLNQQQRQALLDAAQLAGLNVLSLVHDSNAAAINYAMDRTFDEKNQTVIIYDMGAKYTRLSLVEYSSHVESIKGSAKNKTVTSIIVKDLAWDDSLGGYDFDLVIVNYFKSLIKKNHPNFNVDDAKVTIKLLKECTKAKETLSVNQQAGIHIGGLIDDNDFSATITKQKFEELIAPLVERAIKPLKKIIESTGLKQEQIDLIELVGGGTRVPAIQQALREYMKREVLDKHMNGDEAMANGAVFYAASLTTYFRVKDIRLKDISPVGYNVEIIQSNPTTTEETTTEEGAADEKKSSVTQLFKPHSRLNIKKTMSFNTDSSFKLNVTSPEPFNNIALYSISAIPVASDKLNFTGKPKVHCSFRLNTNGMIVLEKAEAEITVTTIKTKNIKSQDKSLENSSTEENKETEAPEPAKVETELVTKVQRVPLTVDIEYMTVKPLDKEMMQQASKKLLEWDTKDKDLKALRKEMNNLEAFIYETRGELEFNDEYQACSTQQERDTLMEELNKANEWYSEALDNGVADIEQYKTQLKDIKKKASVISHRVHQKQQVPSELVGLEKAIMKFQPLVNNIAKDYNLTIEEMMDFSSKFDIIKKWTEDKKEEISKEEIDYTKDLSFSTSDIRYKIYELEKMAKDMIKKKIRIPPKKATPKSKPNTTEEKPTEAGEPTPNVEQNGGSEENVNEEQEQQQQQQQPQQENNENNNNNENTHTNTHDEL